MWLSPDTPWLGVHPGVNGRLPGLHRRRHSNGADAESVVPVALRQSTLTVNIPVRCQTEPLHLPVDSTGLRICSEGE
ncbi:transposase [Laribacter hongkongensis]|uniref:transposase n=1 Tax=Laribacter hongkongensis TaxID=168471 RepID=UPI00358DC809